MASSSRQWKSRDEFKKAKELEEQRKAGTIAPEVDEEGNDINPHIPAYIRQAPWYLDIGQSSLKHQRYTDFEINNKRHSHDSLGTWYARGQTAGPAATKYRPGACTNCGSMTHQAKFCVERPRKQGAKYTGEDIRPDEIIKDVSLDYEGKRDRWNGYDPEEYKRVIDIYERTDQERMRIKAEEQARKFLEQQQQQTQQSTENADSSTSAAAAPSAAAADSTEAAPASAATGSEPTVAPEEDDGEERDDFLETAGEEGRFQDRDSKSKQPVRNLRIREDTAKYLRNLNPDSAFYDPKTRSMRANPNPENDDSTYKGDNFVRLTGDAQEFYKFQKFAWEAEQRGDTHHAQAVPSLTLQAYQEAVKEKSQESQVKKQEILSQYGGAEHLDALPKELVLAQTEQYVEYTSDGRLVQPSGPAGSMPRSRYEEDVYWGNHTAVWGSFWQDGKWGYACCHQFTKNSYCTGLPTTTVASKAAVADVPPSSAAAAVAEPAPSSASAAGSLDADSSKKKSSSRRGASEDSSEESDSDSSDRHRKKHKHKRDKRHKSSKDSKKHKHKEKSKSKKRKRSASSSDDSDDEEAQKHRRLEKYIREEKRKKAEPMLDERKRKYNAQEGGYDDRNISPEQMEAYHRTRDIWDDPMRNAQH